MDVKALVEKVAEPAITAWARAHLEREQARMTPFQRDEMLLWDDAIPLTADTLNAVRKDVDDVDKLRDRAERFRTGAGVRMADVVTLFGRASDKPAVASALVWHLVGGVDTDLATHLIQLIRERAGLPRITAPFKIDDAGLATAAEKLSTLVAWFCDRQVADVCSWCEAVPVPFGAGESLAVQMTALAEARSHTPRTTPSQFLGFARLAATFLVQLSAQRVDPLGYPLERDVQVENDPALERRVEVASWARRAGHLISPRGTLIVLAIPIQAPWPWRLELIAAEPGHGSSGCLGLLLRICADGKPSVVTARAPMLLLAPGEPDEERGARFERWLAQAYVHATSEWRAWM